jgi:hypothetical protein
MQFDICVITNKMSLTSYLIVQSLSLDLKQITIDYNVRQVHIEFHTSTVKIDRIHSYSQNWQDSLVQSKLLILTILETSVKFDCASNFSQLCLY